MINAREIKKGNYVLHEGEPYIVDSFSFDKDKINITLQPIFSNDAKSVALNINQGLEEADISRKTASVLFKKRGNLEIMDSYDFSVHKVEVAKDMFESAVEGDQVTYIKFNDLVKILELRKN
jgi:translation elongation factor P/translation initiation factor 5A